MKAVVANIAQCLNRAISGRWHILAVLALVLVASSFYPSGLKGDQILLEARILMVADVVEAMASHRPYRAALGIEPTLQEIVVHAEKFDVNVVRCCLGLFREMAFAFNE
jgi:hypothetical protein